MSFSDCSGDAKERALQKVPQSSEKGRCFWRRCFVHTCGHRFIFCSSVIGLHLHAASILQSIAVNRLQRTALSGRRYLYSPSCGSTRALNRTRCRARVPGLHKQEFYSKVVDFKLSKRLRRDQRGPSGQRRNYMLCTLEPRSLRAVIDLVWATLKSTTSLNSRPVFVIGADSSQLNTPVCTHSCLVTRRTVSESPLQHQNLAGPDPDPAGIVLMISSNVVWWIEPACRESHFHKTWWFLLWLVFSKHSSDSYLICVLSPRLFNRL